MKYKTFGCFAVAGAITLFFSSVLFLLGFAFSSGAINQNSLKDFPLNDVLVFVLRHFNLIAGIFTLIMIGIYFFVYFGLVKFGEDLKNKRIQYSSYAILTAFLLSNLSTLFLLSGTTFQGISFLQKLFEVLTAASCIWIGIVLLKLNHPLSYLIKVLSVFFIVQGFVISSNLFLPVRVVDFSIAIMIALSSLFYALEKSKLRKR